MANHIPGLNGSSETARLQHRVLALMPLRAKLRSGSLSDYPCGSTAFYDDVCTTSLTVPWP